MESRIRIKRRPCSGAAIHSKPRGPDPGSVARWMQGDSRRLWAEGRRACVASPAWILKLRFRNNGQLSAVCNGANAQRSHARTRVRTAVAIDPSHGQLANHPHPRHINCGPLGGWHCHVFGHRGPAPRHRCSLGRKLMKPDSSSDMSGAFAETAPSVPRPP